MTSVHVVQVQSITNASESLVRWLIEEKGLPPQRADVTAVRPDGSWAAFANQDVKEGEVGQTLLGIFLSKQVYHCDILLDSRILIRSSVQQLASPDLHAGHCLRSV